MSSVGSVKDPVASLAEQIQQSEGRRVQVFTARTVEVPKEKLEDARYIGDLRTNQNRLNVFTLLSKGDREDYFRCNVTIGGKVRLGYLVDELDRDRNVIGDTERAGDLRVQLIRVRGSSEAIVADSDPKAGEAYERFLQLSDEGLELKRDNYVVRVSRGEESSDTEYFYSLQLVGGRYYQDYDTQEAEPPLHPKPASPASAAYTSEPPWLSQFVNQLF